MPYCVTFIEQPDAENIYQIRWFNEDGSPGPGYKGIILLGDAGRIEAIEITKRLDGSEYVREISVNVATEDFSPPELK
jgi:hypothetical protein